MEIFEGILRCYITAARHGFIHRGETIAEIMVKAGGSALKKVKPVFHNEK